MQRGILIFLSALISFILSSCSYVSKVEVNKYPEPPASAIADGAFAKTITISKIANRMNRGEQYGCVQIGLICRPFAPLTWRGGGQYVLNDQEYTNVLIDELKKFNYSVVGDPNSLFEDPSKSQAEIMIGASLTSVRANICVPYSGYGLTYKTKGEASVTVEWQIYATLDRKVIYKVSTSGSSEVPNATPNGTTDIYYNAFSQAVRGLLADPGFQKAVSKDVGSSRDGTQEYDNKPLAITIDKKTAKPAKSFGEAKNAVFTMLLPGGHGSGFFISPDGYALTNFHVVKETQKIKGRDLNGREIVFDVLRRDQRRDIALIKASGGTYPYLQTHLADLPVGNEVYAIGSPFKESLQGSVTKGIVSSYRTHRGKKELQSDVAVSGGNSGGPLVDAGGNVVGVCAWGYDGQHIQNLNFFIPIADGLEKLGVTIQ